MFPTKNAPQEKPQSAQQNPPLLEVLELVEILHSTIELNEEAPDQNCMTWQRWI